MICGAVAVVGAHWADPATPPLLDPVPAPLLLLLDPPPNPPELLLLDPPPKPPELLLLEPPPKPPELLLLDPPPKPPELLLLEPPPNPPLLLEPPPPPSNPGFEELLPQAMTAPVKQAAPAMSTTVALPIFANILFSSDDDERYREGANCEPPREVGECRRTR